MENFDGNMICEKDFLDRKQKPVPIKRISSSFDDDLNHLPTFTSRPNGSHLEVCFSAVKIGETTKPQARPKPVPRLPVGSRAPRQAQNSATTSSPTTKSSVMQTQNRSDETAEASRTITIARNKGFQPIKGASGGNDDILKPKAFGKFASEAEVLKSLANASLLNPTDIVMVVMKVTSLYSDDPSRTTVSAVETKLQMGTLVTALFKCNDWLYVRTPHGHHGYVLSSSCTPLCALPCKKRENRSKNATPDILEVHRACASSDCIFEVDTSDASASARETPQSDSRCEDTIAHSFSQESVNFLRATHNGGGSTKSHQDCSRTAKTKNAKTKTGCSIVMAHMNFFGKDELLPEREKSEKEENGENSPKGSPVSSRTKRQDNAKYPTSKMVVL